MSHLVSTVSLACLSNTERIKVISQISCLENSLLQLGKPVNFGKVGVGYIKPSTDMPREFAVK